MKNRAGLELSETEQTLVAIYQQLYDVVREQGADLAPYQVRNTTKALACLWQVVNGLDVESGHPDDARV
jgi:hypothetical protein